MSRSSVARCLVAAGILFSFSAPSQGFELFPGRVRNPAGLQLVQKVIYNPITDSYLLLYEDGRALIGHLSTAGVHSGEVALSADIGVTHTNGAFNPDDGTALVVFRDGDPAEIYGHYVTSDGTPIGDQFFIGVGYGPNIDYSSESGRYVVSWEQGSSGTIRYRVVEGDSTSPSPNITAGAQATFGFTDGLAYGSVAEKFLLVYSRDLPGGFRANVYGRFITADGMSVGPEFGIATGIENQQKPKVGYAPSTNRWMVTWENWASCGGGCPNVGGALVDETGAVVKVFTVVATPGWDVPGPIVYNETTDTLITGWRSAVSDTNIKGRAGEFSPVDGKLIGTLTLLSDLNVGVEGAAARPDPVNPQVVFLSRNGFGEDGIHAHIVNLVPPLPDTIKPVVVTDLSGGPEVGGIPVPATAIDSTTPGPSPYDMTKTTDGNAATYFASPDRNVITQEFIVWDIGSVKNLSNVALLSRSSGNLFPVDYQIQVSTDNVNFTTVFSVTGAAPALGTWVDHPLPSPAARYVKLLITKTKKSGTGKYKAQVAEVEILEAPVGTSVGLHFTAPGDDGDTGTAAGYDIRWSLGLIHDGNFGAATPLAPPSPSVAGTMESMTFSGFPAETQVFFALKARDEVPNWSDLSNVISVATQGVPPAPVAGLTATNPTGTGFTLVFPPSGDDGNTGNATTYVVAYSTTPVDDANFDAVPQVILPATTPKPAFEMHPIAGLLNQTTYYFAIKARDELGNESLINSGGPVTGTTLDAIPPSGIMDLAVQVGGALGGELSATAIASSGEASSTVSRAKAVDGNPSSYWGTPGRLVQQEEFILLDLGSVQNVGRVTLLSRSPGVLFPLDVEIQLSIDNVLFGTVDSGVDLPATAATLHTFDFPTASARYVRIRVTETRASGTGLFYAQISEIEVWEGLSNSLLTVTWTETGDDAGLGTSSSFDLRFATSSIDNQGEFNAASTVVGEPVPQGSGAHAIFQFEAPLEAVTSLTLFFRIQAFDEAGNPSPLSNQDSVVIPADTTAPSTVNDLSGSAPFSIDLLEAPAIAASSAASGSTAFANATDGNLSSYWGSAGTPTLTVQTITLDTASTHNIGQVRIRSRSAGALFPEDLEIQLSADNVNFTTVHTAIGLPSTPGLWHDLAFPAAMGRYVRIRATKPRATSGGIFYTQVAEIEVYETTFFSGPVTLRWTAPGDDGPNGTATSYDVRFSTIPIPSSAVFNALPPANQATGEPSPHAPGVLEVFEVAVPAPGAYFFAIVTRDGAGNASGLSNVPVIAVP